MKSTVPLRLTAELKDVSQIRDYISGRMSTLGVDRNTADGVMIAVTEMIENILIHGYDRKPGLLEVDVRRKGSSLFVHFWDLSTPFDPTQVPPPNLSLPIEKRPLGGLGIFICRHFIDKIIYRKNSESKNELILVKQAVKWDSESPDQD